MIRGCMGVNGLTLMREYTVSMAGKGSDGLTLGLTRIIWDDRGLYGDE